jgi:predicted dienelactone hydrolase
MRTLTLLLLFGCSSSEEMGLDSAAPPPDAPGATSWPDSGRPDTAPGALDDPAAPGPWAVGVRTLSLTDPARSRTFSVEVWYPVDPAATDGSPNEYEVTAGFGVLATLESPARRDAAPAGGGPWPLVIFSHGFGGLRTQSFFWCEHLASHGFVVAAPDHPGNTIGDVIFGGGDAAQSAMDRPLDVQHTLDRLLAGDAGAPFAVDGERVAVTGHSFGGWTSLEVARRDPRFKVVVPLAPGFKEGATPDFVAELARPIALFGGSEDDTTPFDTDQLRPYELAAPPKLLVEILGAGHLDFSNLCEIALAAQFVDDGCDPALIEPREVHTRVMTVGTAFLRRFLSGETGYDAWLEEAAVLGLGRVEVWSMID